MQIRFLQKNFLQWKQIVKLRLVNLVVKKSYGAPLLSSLFAM